MSKDAEKKDVGDVSEDSDSDVKDDEKSFPPLPDMNTPPQHTFQNRRVFDNGLRGISGNFGTGKKR